MPDLSTFLSYTTALLIPITIFLTLAFLADTMLFSKNHFQVAGTTALITGGSQGTGLSLAILLARKGANVVIVARNEAKLAAALTQVKSAAASQSQRFNAISADVTSPAENHRILDQVTSWNAGSPPDIVWAVAGAAAPGLFLDTSLDTLRAQMDINYWAATYLAHATLALWTAHPQSTATKRHLVLTSSVVAFCGLAGYAPYAPAKAALRALHDALRSELNLYNATRGAAPEIKISTVFPGTILTPGYEHENLSKHAVTKALEEGDPAQTPEEVARVAVQELEKGRSLVTTQMLGAAMRASSMMGSPRDRWFVDTVFSWATSIAWLFIAPDMEGKVVKWAKKNGAPVHAESKKSG